jgi:hypothetical protein
MHKKCKKSSIKGNALNNIKGEIYMIGKYVIIRGDRSGVFAGTLVSQEGREVVLKNCRRLWYWSGAASLSQLAMEGVKHPRDCKFTVTVTDIKILDAIEVIPTTEAAEASIKAVPEWKK